MGRTTTGLFYTAVFGLTPLLGPGCISSGAQFVPATGVLTVTGTDGPDSFVVSATANGSIVVNGGIVPISGGVPTVSNTVRIELVGRGGDDQLVIDEFGGSLPDAVLNGGAGADVLIAGSGNDSVSGGEGDDQIFLGAGDDKVFWSPGDGLDTIEGQGGFDTLVFTGSDVTETFDLSANGARLRLFRDVDAVATDVAGVEAIELAARGGSDTVVVNDLTGTDVTDVRIDLGATSGGVDGQADSIVINATAGDDAVGIAGDAGAVRVFGLKADVRVFDAERDQDRLTLNALGGNDVVDATAPGADGIQLVLNGGLGNDTISGSDGADFVNGGDGNDLVFMGPGDDTFTWNPGDDSDTVEGQAGVDRLVFNGANIGEAIDISANGTRVRFSRNIAAVTTDLNGVEAIDFRALGGADVITVGDLSGTGVAEVNLALAGSNGAGDQQVDGVTVLGTDAADVVEVIGDASGVSVTGLPAQVNVTGMESASDVLAIGAGAGDDAVSASSLKASGPSLTVDGGPDDDVLIGGEGADWLLGGEGDDVLIGGPGQDALDGGPGNNILIQ